MVSDVRVSETVSDSVENLIGATGATSRKRVKLQGSGTKPLATFGVLKPSLEACLRYADVRVLETNAGPELRRWAGIRGRHDGVRGEGAAVARPRDTEYEEWGCQRLRSGTDPAATAGGYR